MEWTHATRQAMKRHVASAIERLDPQRYWQEPAYVAALLARLDGIVYSGPAGRIELQSTIVADRGPHSAESRWGADFAIIGIFDSSRGHVEKGVLGQAKKGSLLELSSDASGSFLRQCQKMSEATDSIVGLEVPSRLSAPVLIREIDAGRLKSDEPAISGDPRPVGIGVGNDFAGYLADRFLTCFHGDRRPSLVDNIRDSSLSHLTVIGETVL
jgi:hypothetical protein